MSSFIKFETVGGTPIINPNPDKLSEESDKYFPVGGYTIIFQCEYDSNDRCTYKKSFCFVSFDHIGGYIANILGLMKNSNIERVTIADTINAPNSMKKIFALKIMEDVNINVGSLKCSIDPDFLLFSQVARVNIKLDVIDSSTNKSQGNLTGTFDSKPSNG